MHFGMHFCMLAIVVVGTPTCTSNPKYASVMAQLNSVDFRTNLEYSLALNSGLKAQFTDLLVQCPDLALLSRVLDLVGGVIQANDAQGVISIMEESGLKNEQMLLGKSSMGVLTSLSLLGTVVRARLDSNHPLLLPSCSASNRYVSSAQTTWEQQPFAWKDSGSVFPIAARVRDLWISRSRCVEDSTVSLVSLVRSLRQVNLHASKHVESLLEIFILQIPPIRLLGGKWPIVDMLVAMHAAGFSTDGDLRLIAPPVRPTWHASSKLKHSGAPLFGFDCPDGRVEMLVKTAGATHPPALCEAEAVIKFFTSHLNPSGPESRKAHLYLQSINANWFPDMAKGWGYLISKALIREVNLEVKNLEENLECKGAESFIAFVHEYLARPTEPGIAISAGLRAVMEIHPDCTVIISAAFTLIHDAWLRLLSGGSWEFETSVRTADLAQLLEVAWQSVAGEKLDVLLHHPVGLFALMHAMWARLGSHEDITRGHSFDSSCPNNS